MLNKNTVVKHHHYTKDKKALMTRIRRIEGQAKGIDTVHQINALSSAVNEVALIIPQNHIEGCVTDAIREQREEDYIKELMATIRKAMKR